MAVIWGFDMSEMSWSAFSHKRMFDTRWHLRKERFIVYQLAMLISLVAECTATYSLSKYEDLQTNIEKFSNQAAAVHNNDLIDAAISTIVFCVLVATIFGADFFFLVFWPRRRYPTWYTRAKEAAAVVVTAGMAASTLVSTVIVATHAAAITGVDAAGSQQLVSVYSRPPLIYHRYYQNILWVVFLWIAFLCTVASTFLMFIAAAHDERQSPESTAVMKNPDSSEGHLAESEQLANHDQQAPKSGLGSNVEKV